MTEPTVKVQELEIDINDIINIFQFDDPGIFRTITSEDTLHFYTENIKFVLSEMHSNAHQILDDDERITNIRIMVSEAQDGSSIYVARYTYSTPSGTVEDRFTMTMAKTIDLGDDKPDMERYSAESFFTCSGIFKDKKTLIVKESIARYPDKDGEPFLAKAANQHDFYATMHYASAFFINMLSGQESTIENLNVHLTDEAIAKALEGYKNLRLRQKYDTHFAIKNPNTPADDENCTLKQKSVINIFQLQNTDIYPQLPPDDYDEIVKNIRDILAVVQSDYAQHFDDNFDFTDEALLYMQNDYGDSLFSIPYIKTDFWGIPRNYHMMICMGLEAESNQTDDPVLKPLAVITGRVDIDSGKYEPLEAICYVKGKTKFQHISLKTAEGFLSAQCYAEAAMEAILRAEKLDPAKLGRWLETKNTLQAMQRHLYLAERTHYGLASSVEDPTEQHYPDDDADDDNDFVVESQTLIAPPNYLLN